jgi:hypothetical protein
MLNAKAAINRLALQIHTSLHDNIDAEYKLRWLEENDYKTYYWAQWITLKQLKTIGKDMYNPDTEEIADWMIRERTIEVKGKSICFNPRAFCWDSGKRLFLKPVTVIHTMITDPGDPLKETFYFEPKRYTMWLLKT